MQGCYPYVVYVNPYFVAVHYDETMEASKHYYMGSQRISTALLSASYDVEAGEQAEFGAVQNLSAVLEHFGQYVEEDYLMEDLLYLPSIADYYPIDYFSDDTEGCDEDPECLCEYSGYWAEESGANCDELQFMYCCSVAETPQEARAGMRGYHPDYLGNTEFITDHAGEPYQFFFYSPWGEVLEDHHSLKGSYYSVYRFNAKELDEETSNYYYGARYYDPKVSVWLSVDQRAHWYPSTSPYAYVLNNPVNLVDPTGMSAVCPDCPNNGEYDFEINSPDFYSYESETGNTTHHSGTVLDEAEVTAEKGFIAKTLEWLGNEAGGVHWITKKEGDLSSQGEERRRGYGPTMDADDWVLSPSVSRTPLDKWLDVLSKAVEFHELIDKFKDVFGSENTPPASPPVPQIEEPAPQMKEPVDTPVVRWEHFYEGGKGGSIYRVSPDSAESWIESDPNVEYQKKY